MPNLPIRLLRLASILVAPATPLAACSGAPAAARDRAQAGTGQMRFAILTYEQNDAWNRLPPAERDALLERYGLWVRGLRASGVLREGSPLGRGGVEIELGSDGVPDAEPLDVNDTSLTGYFIIEVGSAAEAERIAAACPALAHGEVVHVRPAGHVD